LKTEADIREQFRIAIQDVYAPQEIKNKVTNPTPGACGGTVSQQDESGQAGATTTHQTANPTLELQRATITTPPPGRDPTCEDCFNTLSDDEQASFLQQLPQQLPAASFSTVEELCNFLNQVPEETYPV
ncbi:MAG: hypothetical protein WBX81_05795, partial [Nitrososphaeraceae archaeon]